jgi:hypothetical protein
MAYCEAYNKPLQLPPQTNLPPHNDPDYGKGYN